MKLKVHITFVEEYESPETFTCVETPYVDDWITLYLEDSRRTWFPKEKIASIESWYE